MLAWKVDGEHPASYSYLPLVAWKLEKKGLHPRDPLPPKTASAGRSNTTHSQTSGNLFPSQKLKGYHTFTAQSTTSETMKLKKTQGVKPEGEGDWVFSRRGCRNLKWSWRSRSVCWAYHSFCQCGQVVSKEKSKLLWMWWPWPSHERFSKRP